MDEEFAAEFRIEFSYILDRFNVRRRILNNLRAGYGDLEGQYIKKFFNKFSPFDLKIK